MFYYVYFLCGHQLYFRQNIDHVQTRNNQGIATYIFTISVSFCISISLQLPVMKACLSMRYFMCLYLWGTSSPYRKTQGVIKILKKNFRYPFPISNSYLTKKHKSVISALHLLLPGVWRRFSLGSHPQRGTQGTYEKWCTAKALRTLTLFGAKMFDFATLFKTRDLTLWLLFIWFLIQNIDSFLC